MNAQVISSFLFLPDDYYPTMENCSWHGAKSPEQISGWQLAWKPSRLHGNQETALRTVWLCAHCVVWQKEVMNCAWLLHLIQSWTSKIEKWECYKCLSHTSDTFLSCLIYSHVHNARLPFSVTYIMLINQRRYIFSTIDISLVYIVTVKAHTCPNSLFIMLTSKCIKWGTH